MKKYKFTCPKCGKENDLLEIRTDVIAYAGVAVVSYDKFLEIEELDWDYDMGGNRKWICGNCDWELPCSSDDELIGYIVAQQEDKNEL